MLAWLYIKVKKILPYIKALWENFMNICTIAMLLTTFFGMIFCLYLLIVSLIHYNPEKCVISTAAIFALVKLNLAVQGGDSVGRK